MTRIFIDDERFPTANHDNSWVILRSFNQVMEYLDQLKKDTDILPDYISFDHDLGEDQPSGYDIAKKLVELDMDGIMLFPDNFAWTVHSMNPVGKENIDLFLRSYMEFRKHYYNEGFPI